MSAEASSGSVEERIARLRTLFREMGEVVIAFSGGVDSALMLKVAVDELGDRALALTGASASIPARELAEAEDFARALGARHRVLETKEVENPQYAANPADRCFHCKTELFDVAFREAQRLGIAWTATGTILDDLSGHRPGLRAAAERNVRHPLVEAGFSKADVRAASLLLGLPTWNKPELACLASRFPTGTPISAEKLRQVELAEDGLKDIGFRQLRVRYHGEIARIELDPDELPRIAEPGVRERAVAAVKNAGFRFVTIDLQGYRRGSLTQELPNAEEAGLLDLIQRVPRGVAAPGS